MKAYQEKVKALEMAKESLKQEKQELKLEVSRLKEQLDTFSIASHSSSLGRQKNLSHSCSSLYERDMVNVSSYICNIRLAACSHKTSYFFAYSFNGAYMCILNLN